MNTPYRYRVNVPNAAPLYSFTLSGAMAVLGDFNLTPDDITPECYDGHDRRHGGPFDRGSADSYYGRGRHPHYFKGNTNASEEVRMEDMTVEEIAAYDAGYYLNENVNRDFKDYE